MSETDNYICVIGSSAGGINALKKLFTSFSSFPDNIAFIVAQHLSPGTESHLAKILSAGISIPVVTAASYDVITPGRIYIAPPDKNIVALNGKIILKPANTIYKPNIDHLFTSAAAAYGKKLIGVVLTGSGKDGAKGMAEIKKQGGYTIVQLPSDAEYDSMPLEAIRTHTVDAIVECRLIPGILLGYANNKNLQKVLQENDKALTPLKQIFNLLLRYSGTDFSGYKTLTIERRMELRMTQVHCSTIAEYLAYINKNPHETGILHQYLLIGVTSFFRDKEAFALLHKKLAELLIEKKGGSHIRIWSAACSTGEEAYTLAIMVCEILGEKISNHNIKVYASDIDEVALAFARKGAYTTEQAKNISQNLLAKYFTKTGDVYTISKAVRQLVVFHKHDITSDPPFVQVELISCRNMLIYFNQQAQNRIISSFHYALKDGGMLFLGKSENISKHKDIFATISSKYKLYKKTATAGSKYPLLKKKGLLPVGEPAASKEESLSDMLKDGFYKAYEHAFLVINEKNEVQHIQGDIARFVQLAQGGVTLNILRMVRADLQIELRSLLHNCIKQNKAVYGHIKHIALDKDEIYLRLAVWPLTNADGQAKLFVVAFEVPAIAGLLPMLGPGKKLSAKNTRVIELENELAQTKEQLQAFIDQLEAANSQQQLLNEELHSTNEELQVANEELEANNEEQQEANTQIAEAYSKLQELHGILEQKETALRLTSNTFQTVLDNAHEGYVLVGKNYTLAAFNHEADNFFVKLNKTPLVAGESMFRFLPLDFITIFKERFDSAWAGATNSYQIKHVIDGDTFWINARYSPVYGLANTVESVLLSFYDVTTTVIAQQKIDASELLFRSMTENSTDIIFRKDADGKILYISSSISRITGYNQQQLLNHHLFEFLHEDDVPAITAVHKTVLVSPDNSVKLEFRLKHADGRLLWMEGMAVNMLGVAGVASIIVNIRDVTERKQAEQKLLASELRFRSLIENSHDGIALLGREGKMVYLSTAVERILGYTSEELTGVDPQTLAHPDEIAPILGILEELAPRFGETATTEYRMKHKNGEWRWLKSNITNQLHQEGIGAFVFNYEDITEQKESEDKLLNYEANLKTIFDNTEIAYTMLDKQLNMVTFNRRANLWAETFFGKQLKMGKALLAYIKNGAEGARLRVLLKKVLEGKDIKFDFHMAAPDGDEMWYIARINPVTGHDGQVHGVCLAISDITLRKKHEIEMEKMTADLIQRNKDLEQFTFVVSHNLRAPLTNIMGLSQLLMDDHQIAVFKDGYANQLLQSAQKMDVIIKDLNYILQIKKEVREVKQTVYFSELVQDIKQSIQLIIIQQDVAIVTDFAEVNELLTIKSYLYSIFYNLITNSIKYRQQGKQMLIVIKSKVIANKVELEITDNGLGIDLKRKGKEVFGLYKRFHYHVEGKGMGLFMVKTQVEALGGTIRIESEVNKGTTFTISFPLN